MIIHCTSARKKYFRNTKVNFREPQSSLTVKRVQIDWSERFLNEKAINVLLIWSQPWHLGLKMIKRCEKKKGMVKPAKKTCNLFCNIATKQVEMRRCAFYQSPSNLSCNKSGCCRVRKVVAESWEWFYFLHQNLYTLRVLRAQAKVNLFFSKWHNSRVWCDSRVVLSNQKFLICYKTGLTVGGRTRNIAIQLFLQKCCKTSCRLLLPVL